MLNLYKASAGSGKTFRLTFEYIKMLLGYKKQGADNYSFYNNYKNMHRRILAVTFTNKATAEMKGRIVQELDLLAHTPNESKHTTHLCDTFACSERELQEKCVVVLQQLLHDFSFFNISTIDSFFQQVLRAFTREVGLQGGYEVELDSSYVTGVAIDRMFEDLEVNEQMLEWLLQYAVENIRNDGSWNIQDGSDISKLAKQLTSEMYKKYRPDISKNSLKDYGRYNTLLINHQKELRRLMSDKAKGVIDAINDSGISRECFTRGWIACIDVLYDVDITDMSSKGAMRSAINKFIKYYEQPHNWFAASKLKKSNLTIEDAIRQLTPSFNDLYTVLDEPLREYISVPICLKHIYALGVLSTIDENIGIYEREHNSLLLSNTSEILSGLINESDAPFIYEKIGTRVAHYMIDEFQDTSNMQWSNFQPLINESLSHNYENLIVGDVKQSIYRWRNSNWELLHSGLDSYNYHNISPGHDTNWRSCYNVIAFNNTFFKCAAKLLHSELQNEIERNNIENVNLVVADVFDSVAQKVSPDNSKLQGRVSVHILKKANKDTFKTDVMGRIAGILKELFAKGYRQKDIAFLVRKGDEGRALVELLLSYGNEGESELRDVRVVSDESLLISSAPPIKLIVGILRYLQNPTQPINELLLAYEYAILQGSGESEALIHYFDDAHRNIDERLKAFIDSIATKSLFEMCECIVKEFKMNETATYVAYIEAFQDLVVEYCNSHSSDLYSFLRWWNEKEKSASVKSPANVDAITVMTVHKSKGLEFPVVIVPFATWPLSSTGGGFQSSLQWYVPDREPFNALPVLPIDHKSDLAHSIFARQYYQELICEYIDNLNIAYVAFTRARQELIVYTYNQPRGGIGKVINEVLNCEAVPEHDCPTVAFTLQESDDEAFFEVGNDWKPIIKKEKDSDPMRDITYDVVIPTQMRLKQRSHSQETATNSRKEYGVLMHSIMAEITGVDDVKTVVERYAREGRLKQSMKGKIIEKLIQLITQPDVARWFAPDVRVVAESDILKSGERIARPDRVVIDGNRVIVIDYKFGRLELAQYTTRVKEYMQLVREMGYTHVEGYLWYVEKNKIVPV